MILSDNVVFLSGKGDLFVWTTSIFTIGIGGGGGLGGGGATGRIEFSCSFVFPNKYENNLIIYKTQKDIMLTL